VSLAVSGNMAELITSPLVRQVIGSAIDVHRALGPGLLESVYQTCLAHELGLRGVRYISQAPLPVVYKGMALACGYRVDLIIEGTLLVELKTVDRILPIHHAQMLTYLKLLDLPQALLINFNVTQLRDGLKSFVRTPGPSTVVDDAPVLVQVPADAPASGG
jgi:GxxExxY protein